MTDLVVLCSPYFRNLHISIAGDELELTYAIVETLCKEKSRHDVGPLDVANNLGQVGD